MRSYNDLNLPDFTSFRTERVEMPKRVKPRALDTGVIAAINAAAPELSMNDPAVYVALLDVFPPWVEEHRNSQCAVGLDGEWAHRNYRAPSREFLPEG